MKSRIPQRLYTALPRPRSASSSSASLYTLSTTTTSPLSVFDSPTPSSTPASSSRIVAKPKQQQQHQSNAPSPLALTPTPQPSQSSPSHIQSLALTHPYSPPLGPGFANALILPHLPATKEPGSSHSQDRRGRTTRGKYTLEAGAYGIPKRHSNSIHNLQRRLGLDLAVPVGEDAYFVRDDAVGVADGIGGWARARAGRPTIQVENGGMGIGVSPSAAFATRMMHCVSDELSLETRKYEVDTQFVDDPSSDNSGFEFQTNYEEELEDQLEELKDGIDILQVLERAYERTWRGHVDPGTGERVVLGGATVIVAALDWPEDGEAKKSIDPLSELTSSASRDSHPPPRESAAGQEDPALSSSSGLDTTTTGDQPILKIAQIGDCMGMLVRGDKIIWRSEEMWWDYNTPVQLSPPPLSHPPSPASGIERKRLFSSLMDSASTIFGPLFSDGGIVSVPRTTRDLYAQVGATSPPSEAPTSRHRDTLTSDQPSPATSGPSHPNLPPKEGTPTNTMTPRAMARLTTLPVQTDDILVLASDGLSDNLWDEDVLDEVLRFRRLGVADHGGSPMPSCEAGSTLADLPISSHSPEVSQSSSQTLSTPLSILPMGALLRRHMLAGKISEALCSRAKRVAERRPPGRASESRPDFSSLGARGLADSVGEETPFGRRARELGKDFRGGKRDDISVIVAVVSPQLVSAT